MSLFLATLLFGLALAALGVALLAGRPGFAATLKTFPRSTTASYLLFGPAAAWFLWNIWHLSPADFGDYRNWLFIGFLAVAVLSFKCVPDFLAVRGLAALILLAAMPLLDAAYMEYAHPQRLLMVTGVYLFITAAIWLGAQPWRLRDGLEWLLAAPARARTAGGLFFAYGHVKCVVRRNKAVDVSGGSQPGKRSNAIYKYNHRISENRMDSPAASRAFCRCQSHTAQRAS